MHFQVVRLVTLFFQVIFHNFKLLCTCMLLYLTLAGGGENLMALGCFHAVGGSWNKSLHLKPLQRCYCGNSGSPTSACVMRRHYYITYTQSLHAINGLLAVEGVGKLYSYRSEPGLETSNDISVDEEWDSPTIIAWICIFQMFECSVYFNSVTKLSKVI